MHKNLVHSDKEFVEVFTSKITGRSMGFMGQIWEFMDVEELIGIEFAYTDGKYQDNPSVDETLDVSLKIWRKKQGARFPKEYPCMVVWANERSFDRTGSTAMQALEYVYKKDFQKPKKK